MRALEFAEHEVCNDGSSAILVPFEWEGLDVLSGFAEGDEEAVAGVFAAFVSILVVSVISYDDVFNSDFGLVSGEAR